MNIGDVFIDKSFTKSFSYLIILDITDYEFVIARNWGDNSLLVFTRDTSNYQFIKDLFHSSWAKL